MVSVVASETTSTVKPSFRKVYGETFLQEVYTRDEVMCDRHLLKGLVVHEDIVITLFVEELIRTTFYANILQLLTDVEATLQHATIHYIFEFNAHDGVAFTRLYMQKLNYEIQTAVHADTYAVFNVLAVNHKSIFCIILFLILEIRCKVTKKFAYVQEI